MCATYHPDNFPCRCIQSDRIYNLSNRREKRYCLDTSFSLSNRRILGIERFPRGTEGIHRVDRCSTSFVLDGVFSLVRHGYEATGLRIGKTESRSNDGWRHVNWSSSFTAATIMVREAFDKVQQCCYWLVLISCLVCSCRVYSFSHRTWQKRSERDSQREEQALLFFILWVAVNLWRHSGALTSRRWILSFLFPDYPSLEKHSSNEKAHVSLAHCRRRCSISLTSDKKHFCCEEKIEQDSSRDRYVSRVACAIIIFLHLDYVNIVVFTLLSFSLFHIRQEWWWGAVSTYTPSFAIHVAKSVKRSGSATRGISCCSLLTNKFERKLNQAMFYSIHFISSNDNMRTLGPFSQQCRKRRFRASDKPKRAREQLIRCSSVNLAIESTAILIMRGSSRSSASTTEKVTNELQMNMTGHLILFENSHSNK